MFSLDDDADLLPGAVERLVEALAARPDALAAMATVVLPDGLVHLSGGDYFERDGVLFYELYGHGLPLAGMVAPPVRECRWISLGATLVRRVALEDDPLDTEMSGYYEDFEWCVRAGRGDPRRFLAVLQALVLHHHEPKVSGPPVPSTALRFAPSIARFYLRHGLIIQNLFDLIPTLRTAEETPDLARARLLLELIAARGAAWTTAAWAEGELELLLQRPAAPGLPPEPQVPAATDVGEAAELAHRLALREARDEVESLREELASIHGSRWWKLASGYWWLRRRLRGAGGAEAGRPGGRMSDSAGT